MSATTTSPSSTDRRSAVWSTAFFGVGVSLLAMLLAVLGLWLPTDGERAAPAGGAATGPLTVQVTLTEMSVEPARIEVAAGQELIVEVTNAGTMAHDLKAAGTTGTDLLQPGESATVSLGTFDADTQAWCTVPGHKAAGMVTDIVVTGGDGAATPAASAPDPASTGAQIDADATPADDWNAADPRLQPAPGGTVHEVTLRATEVELEVAPGVTQKMWTFEDQVPGPVLRGKVGDVFNVTLTNEGEVGHSIDFHASEVAWNDEMRTIQSGESLVYSFKAEHAGAFMYHCGTNPTLHHIGNGMYGAIIIDPPELAPVDHEFLFVQSELYLGPQGAEGDLDKMVAEDWDAVVFNGYHNQYQHQPIRVEPGERIRAWVVDAGPSENSAFHVVGTVFDTVWKEGTYLLRPDARRGGSQVLDLQPAQGGFVEFDLAEDGFYPLVTHKFANTGKGALGLFQAGDVELPAGASH